MITPEKPPIICGVDFSESSVQAAIVADALASTVLGSVAQEVIANSFCPVLVVRSPS